MEGWVGNFAMSLPGVAVGHKKATFTEELGNQIVIAEILQYTPLGKSVWGSA